MSTEWGIFSDESPDYTSESAVESQMYSREEAEKRLAEIREEYEDTGAERAKAGHDDYDDNLYVHECEEPEEEDDDDEEEDDEDESEREIRKKW